MQAMKIQKVLLLAINARYSHPNPALYYLRNSISGADTETILREFTIQAAPSDIATMIIEEAPDILGISVYIWNTQVVEKLLILLEALPFPCKVVLGGPEVSYCPEAWLDQFPALHCIVTGHGEEGFRRVVENAPGRTGPVVRSQNPPFSHIPFPYGEEDLRAFRNRNIYYESSRGCPFRCAYCISSRSDQAPEFRDEDTVLRELAIIMRHRPKLIKFIDRTFNAHKARGRSIWRRIQQEFGGSGTCFHFEIHPALIEEEDIDLLRSCPRGLFQFEIGIQSAHDAALRAVNRTGSWEDIRDRIARIIALGTIHVHTDLIAGLPFEDIGSLEHSFNEVYGLGADHFQFGILKVLPGTEIRERAEEYGIRYDSAPPYAILETKWLSRYEVQVIKKMSFLVDRLLNSGKFPLTLRYCIQLHRSPFSFFRALGERIVRGSIPTVAMKWEDLYTLITGYAGNLFPRSEDYVRDCLGWDWCASSNTHRFPALLNTEDHRTIRGAVRRELIHKLRQGEPLPCTAEELNKARIFIPRTEEFRTGPMENKSAAVFTGKGISPFLV